MEGELREMLENYVPNPENYRFVSGKEDKRRANWWHIWRIGAELPLCSNSKIKEQEVTTNEPPGRICKRCKGHADKLWEK